jgi:hypothetical protein
MLQNLPPTSINVMCMKKTKQQDFQTTWTKAYLFLNSSHGIENQKQKHNVCTMWMQHDFITKNDKNKTRSWKRYVSKTSVEHIQSNVGFYT